MLKRIGLFTVSFVLMLTAIPFSLAESDCDYSYSNHARAAQLHAMGDISGALPYYECALQNDPDNEILRDILNDLTQPASSSMIVDACDTSVSHHAEGAQLYAMGDYQGAMHAFNCVLASDPDNVSIIIQQANMHVKNQDYATALDYLNTAIAIDDAYAPLYVHRGYAYYQLHQYEAGLDDVNTALSIHSDYAPALEVRELILLASIAEQRDIGIISGVVINTAPSATPVPSNTGKNALPQLDDSTDVTVASASEVEPTSPTADTLWAASRVFIDQGRYDLAIEQYEALLGFEPNNASLHFGLGHAHYALEDFSTALSYLKQADELNPNDMYTTYYLSMAHSQLNNRIEALTILDDMYVNNWYDGAFSLVMGHVYHNLGYPEVAGIQFYEWMIDRETLRLPAELAVDSNSTNVMMDYGLLYEIPFSATAGEVVHINVSSHILNPAPIDPLIVVLNEDGIPIAGDDDDGELFDSALTFMPPSTTDYTLIVSHAGGKHAGEMDVQLSGNVWSAQAYRDFAETAFDNQDYALAIDMLNRAIALDGGTADDYGQLALIYRILGDLDSSAIMLSQALELDPMRADLRCELGAIFETWGNDEAALEQFDIILANNTTDPCAWSHRDALMKAQRGDVFEASANAVVVPTTASPAHALYELALQYRAENRTFSAANTFLQAIIVDPNHADARCGLAQIQLDWGNYFGTLQNIDILLEANPNNTCALDLQVATAEKTERIFVPMTSDDFLNRGMELYNAGDLEGAISSFEMAVELSPNDKVSRCYLGIAHMDTGNYNEALRQWTIAINQNSIHPDPCSWSNYLALNQRMRNMESSNASIASEGLTLSASDYLDQGMVAYNNGDLDSAIESFEMAVELSPNDKVSRCYLGIAHMDTGNYNEALRQWTIAINQNSIHPDPCSWSNYRALTYRMRNMESSNASIAAESPITYAPSPADGLYEEGLQKLENNNEFGASSAFLQAVRLDPDHSRARCELAKLDLAWGNYYHAAQAYQILLADNPNDACGLAVRLEHMTKRNQMFQPTAIEDFVVRGTRFYEINEFELAVDSYETALRLDPLRSDVRCQLGLAYAELGDYDEALQQWETILNQHIVDSCARANRDGLMQKLRTAEVDTSASYGMSEAALQNADTFIAQGDQFVAVEAWESAINAYLTALEFEPFRHDIRCRVGMIYVDLGDYDNALYQFNWIMSQDIANICANEHARNVHRIMSDNTLNAPTADDFIAQGDQFVAEELWNSAIDAYLSALDIEPARYDIRCRVGMIYADLQDYEAAKAQFFTVLSQDTSNHCARNHLLNVRRIQRGDTMSVSQLYAQDYASQARDFYLQGDLSSAIFTYHLALDLDPTLLDERCHLGLIYQDLGHYDDAMQQYDIALAQNISHPCSWSSRNGLVDMMRTPTLRQVSDVNELYDIALTMGSRSLFHEAQTRHEMGDVWTASALLDRYIDSNFATMCSGELRWLADEYAVQGYTVLADMMRLKAIGDSTC